MLSLEVINELNEQGVVWSDNGNGTYRCSIGSYRYDSLTPNEVESALLCLGLEDMFDPYYL